jgi:phosphate-selective porin OprO/OprP
MEKNKIVRKISLVLVGVSVLAVSGGAYARDTGGDASIKDQLRDLEQRQKTLERKIENTEETGSAGAVVAAGKDGFSISSPDKKFVLKLRGLIQTDARIFIDGPLANGAKTIVPRSIRPYIEGTVFQRFDFRLVPDFGNGTTTIQDAYVDARFFPELALRVGKFKVPVGLERLQPESATIFAERSLATNLVPNRDLGVQLWGDISGGVISYAFGLFNGVPDGGSTDLDVNDHKDFAGRLFFQPFLKTDVTPLKGLGIGVGASYGQELGVVAATALPTYKTPGQQTFFRYLSDGTAANTVIANGATARVVPQLSYLYGPFSLQGEYAISRQKVTRAATSATLTNKAWQATTSFVLTGENASFKGVKPRHPFSIKDHGWGALEVAARYHELDVDNNAFPTFASATASASDARAFGGGVNWYLNDNLRATADFDHTSFKGGAITGNRVSENLLLGRLQLAF